MGAYSVVKKVFQSKWQVFIEWRLEQVHAQSRYQSKHIISSGSDQTRTSLNLPMHTHRILLNDCPYREIIVVFNNSFKFISKRFLKNQPNLQFKWQLFLVLTSLIEATYDPHDKTRDAQMSIPEHSIGFFEWLNYTVNFPQRMKSVQELKAMHLQQDIM